jgi:hypothetical protein
MSAQVFVATTERVLAELGAVLRWAAAHPPRAGMLAIAERASAAVGYVCDARDGRGDGLAALGAAEAHVLLALAETEDGDAACPRLSATLAELLTATRFLPIRAPEAPTGDGAGLDPRASTGTVSPRTVPRASVRPLARALPVPKPRPPAAPPRESPPAASGPERAARLLAAAHARRAPVPAEPAEDGEPPDLPQGDAPEQGEQEAADSSQDTPRAGDPASAPPPASEESFVRAWSKTLFEELAALGMQRLPLVDDDWRARGFTEDRLLSALDAFVGFGEPAIAAVPLLVADAPAPDPWRMFAAGLVAGCVGGRDTAGFFEEALRGLEPDDPDVAVALEMAARLAPHPEIVAMLRTLRADESPELRVLAARALLAAGAATTDDLLEDAASADPTLASLALPVLARRRSPRAAPLARAALDARDPDLARAAIRTLALSGDPALAPTLARILQSARPAAIRETAALYLGLAGDPDGALRDSLTQPTVGRVLGVGWAGRKEALPRLLACLSSQEDGVPEAAARALARILGQAPIVDRDVPPEDLDQPDLFPTLGPPAPPTDDTDASAGSPDTLRAFSTDPEHWRPLLDTVALPPGRIRHGQPRTPARTLDELLLEDAEVPPTPDERALLVDELVATTALDVAYDPQQWVALQIDALTALRAALP